VQGDRRKLHTEELHFHAHCKYYDHEVKEDNMSGAYSMHGRDVLSIHHVEWKDLQEGVTLETELRFECEGETKTEFKHTGLTVDGINLVQDRYHLTQLPSAETVENLVIN
jgi:hypothetical protein